MKKLTERQCWNKLVKLSQAKETSTKHPNRRLSNDYMTENRFFSALGDTFNKFSHDIETRPIRIRISKAIEEVRDADRAEAHKYFPTTKRGKITLKGIPMLKQRKVSKK